MKTFKKLLFAGLVFTTINATAQTADEIIAKNTEAMGGAAKIGTLTSVKMSGNMSAQGQDFPITITKINAKGMRMDLEIMGTANYQIITPDKGYLFFPIQQMTEPKEMDADAVKAAQNNLDIQGPLYNYKEKGETIVLVGSDKVGGADVFKMTVTSKAGIASTFYIDKKTNRVVKTIGKMKGPDGADMEMETTLSDWKQNASGYWFPYSLTTMNGPITFDKIETNVKVDESIFKN